MDTSPGFAQQMDCVILVYQSNASVDILNSVVNQNMWVRRSRSNKEGANVGNAKAFARIEALEQGLKNLNDQMIILVDMKLQLWIMLSGIGIDTNSDEGGGFPDFAAHYAARSNKR
ncbi:hypothetical protein JG687_00009004 [Phytophthora cactorum]|uniref:Uncharacterized protein n=1 Tax=Phytophthora cactorum TaxID=29920 RepID=A0A8T1UE05_9STRA|nr:hypothetical protein JG687_00009004 [Phytophthora cactorum]